MYLFKEHQISTGKLHVSVNSSGQEHYCLNKNKIFNQSVCIFLAYFLLDNLKRCLTWLPVTLDLKPQAMLSSL